MAKKADIKGRFPKGHIPWNKGKKGLILSERAKATQFKKGCLRGDAARKWRPVGAISFRCDHGLKTKKRRFIKIKDGKPPHKNWIPYARYIWQKHFGPVPEGFFVGHKDGKLLNDNIDNLILLDCSSNLKRLETIRPGSSILAHKKAIMSLKRRWAEYRKLKSSIGPVNTQWECPQCGASYEKQPERCIKCGCLYVEKIEVNKCIAAVL